MFKAVVRIDLLKKILRQQCHVGANPNHDTFGKSGWDQWDAILDRYIQNGETDVDLTQITYELEPIVRIVEE